MANEVPQWLRALGLPEDEEPDQDWLVWFDLACEDIMVIETAGMTPALRREVEAMGAPIKEVAAPTRKAAIAKAFPKGDSVYECLAQLQARRQQRKPSFN